MRRERVLETGRRRAPATPVESPSLEVVVGAPASFGVPPLLESGKGLLSQPACPFRLSLRTVFHPTPDALRRSPRSRGPPRAGQPIVGYRGTGQVGPFGRDDSRVWRLGDKAAEWAERIGNCWKKALRQSSRRARRFARSIRFTATPATSSTTAKWGYMFTPGAAPKPFGATSSGLAQPSRSATLPRLTGCSGCGGSEALSLPRAVPHQRAARRARLPDQSRRCGGSPSVPHGARMVGRTSHASKTARDGWRHVPHRRQRQARLTIDSTKTAAPHPVARALRTSRGAPLSRRRQHRRANRPLRRRVDLRV